MRQKPKKKHKIKILVNFKSNNKTEYIGEEWGAGQGRGVQILIFINPGSRIPDPIPILLRA
jgi:hypothetical protein